MSFITCPNCGTSVEDTALRCPACHADISATVRMPRQVGTWCRGCGALVADGLDVCPSCGLPVGDVTSVRPTASVQDDGEDVDGGRSPAPDDVAVETEDAAKIESALPVDPVEAWDRQGADALPHTRQVLAFVVIAGIVIVLAALGITHPWDPDAYSIKTQTGTDTSKVGFPGEKETLSSQDRSAVADEEAGTRPKSTDETLQAMWVKLGELHDDLLDDEEMVRATAGGAIGHDDAVAAASSAEATALAISNAIAAAEAVETAGTELDEARAHVVTMGNWLRNWSDAIVATWDLIDEYDYAADEDLCVILDDAAQSDGRNAYRALFEESYEEWAPIPLE